MTVHSL